MTGQSKDRDRKKHNRGGRRLWENAPEVLPRSLLPFDWAWAWWPAAAVRAFAQREKGARMERRRKRKTVNAGACPELKRSRPAATERAFAQRGREEEENQRSKAEDDLAELVLVRWVVLVFAY